jgi:hypothetical protein
MRFLSLFASAHAEGYGASIGGGTRCHFRIGVRLMRKSFEQSQDELASCANPSLRYRNQTERKS